MPAVVPRNLKRLRSEKLVRAWHRCDTWDSWSVGYVQLYGGGSAKPRQGNANGKLSASVQKKQVKERR
ncbi:hypothetical protein D5086_020682 [Populus alba]|uniref:Uncharacterized protein n=1 Tax=Populus alba TaxID=43335 RepID=A0ACC4BKQ1_POPAL